jgi:hypothetical protein
MGKNTIENFINEKAKGDKLLISHLIGIIIKAGYEGENPQTRIDKNEQAKLWGLYVEYTGKKSHSEGTHGGDDIALAQFVTSAIESFHK